MSLDLLTNSSLDTHYGLPLNMLPAKFLMYLGGTSDSFWEIANRKFAKGNRPNRYSQNRWRFFQSCRARNLVITAKLLAIR